MNSKIISDILDLKPALISYRYSSQEHRRLDVTGLKNFLSKFADDPSIFQIGPDLVKEMYILGKLLYKMNGPFRRQAHFQMAKRLKKLSERCFDSECGQVKNVSIILREFVSSVQLDEKDNLYSPSGDYFRYVLVNLRSLASNFVRIVTTCVEFCQRMMHMLNLGHFVQQHCLLLGVVARLRSDCIRRLGRLKNFFADFAVQGFLAKGLRLKRANESPIRVDDKAFLQIFDGMDDVEQCMESDRRVSGDNLSMELRKEAIDYFENLFNVRLVEQRDRRQVGGGGGGRKRRKAAVQEIDFRQALVAKPGDSMLFSQDADLGIPISRTADAVVPDDDINDFVRQFLDRLDRTKTFKAVRKLSIRLEKNTDHRLARASQFLKKELIKMERLDAEKKLKKLTKGIALVQGKLGRLLSKI